VHIYIVAPGNEVPTEQAAAAGKTQLLPELHFLIII